jgi:hypothetical protein
MERRRTARDGHALLLLPDGDRELIDPVDDAVGPCPTALVSPSDAPIPGLDSETPNARKVRLTRAIASVVDTPPDRAIGMATIGRSG